jgi:hypothetical protein
MPQRNKFTILSVRYTRRNLNRRQPAYGGGMISSTKTALQLQLWNQKPMHHDC